MNQNPQKAHYDKVIADYDRHYFDRTSLDYRKRCILNPLFDGIDLNHGRLVDLMCGSGYTTLQLQEKYPQAQFTGLDISSQAIENYNRLTGFKGSAYDLSDPWQGQTFDAGFVIGGLHHCITNLQQVLDNISNMIKPGGYLLMMEPNGEYFLEGMRSAWYKKDKYFHAETEKALNHDALLAMAPHFQLEYLSYQGGVGYFLVLNSLLFRIPLALKKLYSPMLTLWDQMTDPLRPRWSSPYFIARWRRL